MTWKTRLNITLIAFAAIAVLLVYGVAQRRADTGRVQADADKAITEARTRFAVEDLIFFVAQTPVGPFEPEYISTELDDRTGAIWFFERHADCWTALQTRAKSGGNRPVLTPYKEPNQPEPLLILAEFENGDWMTFKFVQDAIVECEFGGPPAG